MKEVFTETDKKIYMALLNIVDRGLSPSIYSIEKNFGIPRATVRYRLQKHLNK